MKKTVNVAIYARKSFEDRKQASPIQEQISDCKAFCETHGYNIVDIFTDGESGRCPPSGYEEEFENDKITNEFCRKMKSKRRKGLERLCRLIEDGKISTVVTRDIMRVARPRYNSRLMNWSQNFFLKHNFKIHCIQNGLLDFSDKMTSIMTFLKLALVDDELEKRAQNSLREILKLRKQGLYLSKAPFGYILKNKGYTVDAKQSEIVEHIFELKKSGYSIAEISVLLNKKRDKTQKGAKFIPATVGAILARPIYAGLIPNEHGGFDDCINVPSIIDKNDFLRHHFIRQKYIEEQLPNRTKSTTSLMSMLLICGHCGEYFTSYLCSGKQKERYRNKGF